MSGGSTRRLIAHLAAAMGVSDESAARVVERAARSGERLLRSVAEAHAVFAGADGAALAFGKRTGRTDGYEFVYEAASCGLDPLDADVMDAYVSGGLRLLMYERLIEGRIRVVFIDRDAPRRGRRRGVGSHSMGNPFAGRGRRGRPR